MASENKPNSGSTGRSKKGRPRYLPQNKAAKKKGSYPLRPGVEGFFLTCDGGRERQACQEAIDVIDSFLEELVLGKDADGKPGKIPSKPQNKKITFSYSDSSDSDDDSDRNEDGESANDENKSDPPNKDDDAGNEKSEIPNPDKDDDGSNENKTEAEPEVTETKGVENEAEEPPAKKQCVEGDVPKVVIPKKPEEKSVDRLIEEEIKQLGNKNTKRFFHLDTGCHGVVFIQMRKKEGDASPKDIVQRIMTSAAATKKHMSRFIMRILPVELSCYASEEEISKTIVPLVTKYFPAETQDPQKFCVLYGARANTGIDRMKIINAVAKSIPAPHTVDLTNPTRAIVVEIVKTVCLIGVIEKYKELSKYNLRQLTLPQP